MKRLIGILITVQAILTGIIVYSIERVSDSVKQSASYIATKEGTLGWGEGMPAISLVLITLVIVVGLYLIIRKEKHGK
ncbi:MAG: hypothetical protein ACE3JP_03875 [Ectobacillus sp.]